MIASFIERLEVAVQSDSLWHAGLTTGTTASVKCLQPPGSTDENCMIVEMRMPRSASGKYFAGQWVFVCVPELGLLHWHPFTISSACGEEDLTLHIGAGGNWTNRLVRLAQKRKHIKVRAALQMIVGTRFPK
jgi:hypothetical protein